MIDYEGAVKISDYTGGNLCKLKSKKISIVTNRYIREMHIEHLSIILVVKRTDSLLLTSSLLTKLKMLQCNEKVVVIFLMTT